MRCPLCKSSQVLPVQCSFPGVQACKNCEFLFATNTEDSSDPALYDEAENKIVEMFERLTRDEKLRFRAERHGSVNQGYFVSSGLTNGPLTALQTGTDGGNGVYQYGSVSVFPTNTYNASNYWVDAVFVTP